MAGVPSSSRGSSTGSIGIISQTILTSGDLSSASTTFVDATGVVVSGTTGANKCLVTFSGGADVSTAGAYICVDLAIDTVRQGQAFGLTFARAGIGGAGGGNLSFSFVTAALTAAAHTFQVRWRVTAGTGTFYASTTVTPAILSVVEL